MLKLISEILEISIDDLFKELPPTDKEAPKKRKVEANNEDKLSETASRLLTMLEKEQDNVKNAHDIIRMLAAREAPDINEATKNG